MRVVRQYFAVLVVVICGVVVKRTVRLQSALFATQIL